MKIVFIIDLWGANHDEAISVDHPRQTVELRKKIRKLLGTDTDKVVKFRFTDKAIYEQFNDLEGLSGVEVNHVRPRVQLANIIGETVPQWLSDSNIVKLGLLNNSKLSSNAGVEGDVTGKILSLTIPALLCISTFTEFYDVVHRNSGIISNLLNINEIFSFLLKKLKRIHNLESVVLLLNKLRDASDPSEELIEIGREQVREKERIFVNAHNIANISFPARTFDLPLLKDLPSVQLSEGAAGSILGELLELLKIIDVSIRNNLIDSHHLAEVVVVSWPSFIAHLSKDIEGNPKLATTALEIALDKFDEPHVVSLSSRVRELLKIGSCDPLSISADVHEALIWGREYLTYAQHCFLQHKEPEGHISDSFTTWFLKESLKVRRSDYNWSVVSDSVEENLRKGRLVIFCIVDALGAIHLDLLKKELMSCLEDVHVSDDIVFAPVPTLTEIGKMAVVTGQLPTSSSKVDQKVIVWHRYQDFLKDQEALQVTQSWKEFRNSLDKDTKLLVCFENRIDERLHGCINYEKHQKDVLLVVKSLVKDISDWFISAEQLQKEIEIIISADHGVSSIAKKRLGVPSAVSCGERVCLVEKCPDNIPELSEFIRENTTSKKGFIIPTNRVRYTSETHLVHGGLTAEEVLIPFVSIRKGHETSPTQPLELKVDSEQCQIVDNGWQVRLNLIAHVEKVEKVFVQAGEPFSGREGPIGPLYNHSSKSIRFLLRSSIPQDGLVNIPFIVSYLNNATSENDIFEVVLKLRLPPTLLEKNDGAKLFDDMFD